LEVVIVGLSFFAAALALDVTMEVGAQVSANWQSEWLDYYFWDLGPDANGLESQKQAALFLEPYTEGQAYPELCTTEISDGKLGLVR
jgi:hypothetical protein